MNKNFYDGTKLLSMKDLSGCTPEVFAVTGNRSSGKTTYFSRYLVKQYKKKHSKFGLIYRFSYELEDVAGPFFKEIKRLFFPNDEMTSLLKHKGTYSELFLNGESCGYAFALNTADSIRKISSLFVDCDRLFFDEFQSESNKYCPKELTKFMSLHTSIARGGGKSSRYLPVYMCSNAVTILNPYFKMMGVQNKISPKTKFLRGNGFVIEHSIIQQAATAQKESLFNQAFSATNYTAYASENVYLNDNISFIEKTTNIGRYILTIKYGDSHYGIYECPMDGIVFVSDKADISFPIKITATIDSHDINYLLVNKSSGMVKILRDYFEKGIMRFKNLECKNAILAVISY